MKKFILPALPFYQQVLPPFRAETGMDPALLPVYAAETPQAPPYMLYRNISRYPRYPSYNQMRHVLLPQNIILNKRSDT
ncbi:hypothetical protein [Mesobacillus jeotgali]|uniref:hypothetical protein n=1 Tax=Mesobacillus jeotgali TaxID=129985 RepID=UPI0009A87DAE|nr:hypothetical protein [Mesobacillus jeotgali]